MDVRYSIIVLLEDANDDLADYIALIYHVFSKREGAFEIIVVANGREGFLRDILDLLMPYKDRLTLFALNRKTSQAVCFKAAFKKCAGEIIVICGSYQQIAPESFNVLLDNLDAETDIISPWRVDRVDAKINQLQSNLFNKMVRFVTGTELHDLSCTVKIVRRQVIEETEVYGGMYRFLPILAEKRGFKTKETPCKHHKEKGKTGYFGFFTYFERLIDIIILYFNTRFTKKPLRFFGVFGAFFASTGMLVLLYICIDRFWFGVLIGDRPWRLLLSILLIIGGTQVASIGLLGELIAFIQGRNKKEYSVRYCITPGYRDPERRGGTFRMPENCLDQERRK